jgi:hypothetical protein
MINPLLFLLYAFKGAIQYIAKPGKRGADTSMNRTASNSYPIADVFL